MSASRRGQRWGLLLLVAGGLVQGGCSLSFWRKQADEASYHILEERTAYPHWDVPRLSIQPDPRSRFFDPYCPDHSPLPPDDPAARKYMDYPGKFKGGWHKMGTALAIENPHWLEPYGLTPEMLYQAPPTEGVATVSHVTPLPLPTIERLALPDAIELANIHNRDYQTVVEDAYLSALSLSFERFRFDVRFLGFGGEPSGDLTYTNRPGVSDTLALNTRAGVSQLLPTGGQWVVELANNTLWLFSGDNQTSTASVLSYSIVQPLLRGAGRKIALENLTQSERNVLYSVRDLARFRKVFFSDVVVNGPGGGFLGSMQRRQQILNQIDNIRALEEQVERLSALAAQKPEVMFEPLDMLPPGLDVPDLLAEQLSYNPDRQLLAWRGPMTGEQARLLSEMSDDPDFQRAAAELVQRVQAEVVTLDVAQLETQLANSRQRLLTLGANYADNLDNYKIFLGLPPDMPVNLDESLLEQFQLIDPRLRAAEDAVLDFIDIWAELDEFDPDPQHLLQVLGGLARHAENLLGVGIQVVQQDFRRMEENVPRRLAELEEDEQRQRVRANLERDRRLYRDSVARYEAIVADIDQLRQAAQQPNLTAPQRAQQVSEIAVLREDLLRIIQGLSVVQIGLRVELIALQKFELSLGETTELALQNRLDLMNQRAIVTDLRRKIELAANDLEGVVDVVVEGDIRTPVGNRPFDFRGSRSEFRTGLRFTAPLDQVAERNNYRASLIQYQQARRDYMEFEDRVKFQVRQEWRQLQVLRENFETARQAVRYAALQFDQAVEESATPAQPGQQQQGGRQGLNLLQALNSILNAQDRLIEIWVDYERNRINVHRDMGIMEIDARGVWVDPLYQELNMPGESAEELFLPSSPAEPANDERIGKQSHRDGPPVDRVAPVAYERESDDVVSASEEPADADAAGRARAVGDRRLNFTERASRLDLWPDSPAGDDRRVRSNRITADHRHRAGTSQ